MTSFISKKALLLIILYFCCIVMPGCNGEGNNGATSTSEPSNHFNPMGANLDWQPQDYPNSLAVKTVTYTSGKLLLDTDFIGQDSAYANGEAYLNLRFVPGLESRIPIDMSKKTIKVTVEIPAGFVGDPNSPNGVQAFVKDVNWKSQYSAWQNITKNKANATEYTVTIKPSTTDIPVGYITDSNFDASKIAVIGVKFGIGSNSTSTYQGPLYITGVEIDSPIETAAPPNLSDSIPPPQFGSADTIVTKSDGIYLNGKKWFIVGANWRILDYGQNFGTTDWFPKGNGISIHQNYVKQYMEYLKKSGVKVIRIFLIADGRSIFDKGGHVVGYDDIFKKDISTLLSLAESNGLKVEFVFLDFLIAGKGEEVNGVWLRGRSEIITDTGLRDEYLNSFLIPFLKEFGNHPSVLGFDLMNEPEWIISSNDGGGWEDYSDSQTKAEKPIPIEQMNEFFSQCITNINQYAGGKLITVGVSCKFHGLIKDLNTTHYALHHYPWMNNIEEYIKELPEGKPWILEEFPTRNTDMEAKDYYNKVLTLKGSGAYFWNYKPNSDDYTVSWDDFNKLMEDIRNWVEEHVEDIYKVK